MSKKYELTTKTKLIDGHKVYRIKALKSFNTIIDRKVNKGDLGGWVESEKNLSQDGTCWLFDDAVGYENSRRSENSVGYDNSQQFGNSRQSGNSRQFGNSRQYGDSWQFGNSQQYGNSRQFGNPQQFGNSQQYGNSRQIGSSQQFGNSQQFGDSVQYGDSMQYDNSRQSGDSRHITGHDEGTGCILCIGPCGDSQRTVTVQPDNTIVVGCFHGSFKEFKQEVVAKYGKDYGSYSVCITAIQAVLRKRVNIEKGSGK